MAWSCSSRLRTIHTHADGVEAAAGPLALAPCLNDGANVEHLGALRPIKDSGICEDLFSVYSSAQWRSIAIVILLSRMVEVTFERGFRMASSIISLRRGRGRKCGSPPPPWKWVRVFSTNAVEIVPHWPTFIACWKPLAARSMACTSTKARFFRIPHTGWMSDPIPLCVKCSEVADTAK